MKFKKDDIVEVIKKDKWQGIDYPVGTQLRVCEDQEDECVVRIYDSMQKQGGYAKLWEWNLKLIKREEKPKLDLNNLTTAELREYVELLESKKEEPTTYTKSEINQQISIAYQQFDNDTQRLAYLQGYFAK